MMKFSLLIRGAVSLVLVTACGGSTNAPSADASAGAAGSGGSSDDGAGGAGGSGGEGGSAGAGGSSGAGGSAGAGGNGGSPDAGGSGGASSVDAGASDARADAIAPLPDAMAPCPPLLGYWSADDNALDSVGQNNGQTDGATYGTGVMGDAFVFNGASSVTASRAVGVKIAGDWTYSFFINVAAYTDGTIGAGDGSYFLDRTSPTLPLVSLKAVGGQFAFQVRYDDGTGLGGPIGGAIQTNTWAHVALVREAGVGFTLYVNGRLANTVADDGGALTAPAFKLGRHESLEGFTGSIDELRIFDGALGLAQIQGLAARNACP
jgi:hypothetical protein